MPQKDLSVTQDETFTGGLCLITMDPDNNFIILEQPAQARDQSNWNASMEGALAQFNCRVIQSTSNEAPWLLAYVVHYLGAHHSPDLFHVQHELVKAVSGPIATKERAAHKAVTEASEQLERLPSDPKSTGDEAEKRGPGRPPKDPVSLEQAEQTLDAARREHERLAQQREQVKASIRGIGHDYRFVDLEPGVRRNGQLIASDIQGHIEQIRTIAQHEDLIQAHQAWMETAEAKRVYRLRGQTIEIVFADVKEHRGLRRFSGHGLARVRTEFALEVLLHNLLVVHRSLKQRQNVEATDLMTEEIAAYKRTICSRLRL